LQLCLVAGKPESRQFKAIYVMGDAAVDQATDIHPEDNFSKLILRMKTCKR
jgi:hypothetical protein